MDPEGFITTFTSARHMSLSVARAIHSMSPNPTYCRSILIISSHLSLGFPSCFFPLRLPSKILLRYFCSPYEPHALFISLFLIWPSEWYLVRSAELKASCYINKNNKISRTLLYTPQVRYDVNLIFRFFFQSPTVHLDTIKVFIYQLCTK